MARLPIGSQLRRGTLGLILLPILAACGGPSVEDAEAQLCSDLNGLATALQGLGELNAESTVRELNQAQQNLADAYTAVRDSAKTVEAARLSNLETAYQNFDQTVNSISGRDTLGEAAVTIKSGAAEVVAAREQMHAALNCP